MAVKDNNRLFGTGRFYKSALTIAVPIMLQALCLFCLLVQPDMGASAKSVFSAGKQGQLSERCLLSLDRCTFGIYLTHLVFVKLAFRYAGLDPYAHPAYFPLTVIVVILLSWATTWALKKLPLFRKLL